MTFKKLRMKFDTWLYKSEEWYWEIAPWKIIAVQTIVLILLMIGMEAFIDYCNFGEIR